MVKKKPISPTQECRMSINVSRSLLDRMHVKANETGVPLNQLVRALLEWADQNGHAGTEPVWNQEGVLKDRPQKGVFWLGSLGYSVKELIESGDIQSAEDEERYEGGIKGQEIKTFDFTERVIKRDL